MAGRQLAWPTPEALTAHSPSERWRGTGRDSENFVNIAAGRHITAGVVIGGRGLQGAHGSAGEIGVLPESRWNAALDAMAGWPQGREATIGAASAGDSAALARVGELAEQLATGIAAVVLSVDPECVILSAKVLFPIPVRMSTLDQDAVALGAVRLALDHVESELFSTESELLAGKTSR